MSRPLHDLVIATGNAKKGGELAQFLAPCGIFRIADLREIAARTGYAGPLEVDETGSSFAENARLKASVQARRLGHWVLADDSGIEVDALDMRPGIFSARYAGPQSDDQANNAKLLAELGGRPLAERGAQYACAIALADPEGRILAESAGICRGRVRFAATGVGGFGYDPLFEVREYHRTFGELGPCVKRAVSHRARAMRRIVPQLLRLAREASWPPSA